MFSEPSGRSGSIPRVSFQVEGKHILCLKHVYLNSHEVVEDVEDEAVIFSSWMAETDVDFGTTELVRIIETATVFCCCDLTSFLSEEEDGNGEDVPDRLFPFP